MKGLDIAKLEKEKNFIIVSSEDALKDVTPMIDKEEAKRKMTINFAECFSETHDKYEEYIKLREQCNNTYEELMLNDEQFLKLSKEEQDKNIEEFKNKPFNKLIKCSY
ncbi:hypothetical protein [uncultured Clostridium sp.]|uniref:hypothetical protein n=1 Tax=uncultured Clostridium sp. TaxID=59620 RepID=UPI00321728DE